MATPSFSGSARGGSSGEIPPANVSEAPPSTPPASEAGAADDKTAANPRPDPLAPLHTMTAEEKIALFS